MTNYESLDAHWVLTGGWEVLRRAAKVLQRAANTNIAKQVRYEVGGAVLLMNSTEYTSTTNYESLDTH